MPVISTWNVNSVKARLDRLIAWLGKAAPDVVCLQELKVADEAFPHEEVADAGYHAAVFGQKTWNGVAILSKDAITDVVTGMDDGVSDPQARVISAKTFGIDVVSVYVPNGKSVGSDKWEYKLNWMRRFRAMLDRRFTPGADVVVCGDINIAPTDLDVAKPERWRHSVLCDEAGRKALTKIVEFGLEDVIRNHNEGPGPFSWWDYRMLAFPKGDGLRIDHIFATSSLAARATGGYVDRDERKGQKPSDHAPVLAEFT